MRVITMKVAMLTEDAIISAGMLAVPTALVSVKKTVTTTVRSPSIQLQPSTGYWSVGEVLSEVVMVKVLIPAF